MHAEFRVERRRGQPVETRDLNHPLYLQEEEKAGKRLYVSITEPPLLEEILRGLVSKAQNWKKPDAPYWVIQQINSANNGLTFHAGKLLATYEAGSAHELRLTEQLECEGVCDFEGTWSTKDFWLQNFTAHPKVRIRLHLLHPAAWAKSTAAKA